MSEAHAPLLSLAGALLDEGRAGNAAVILEYLARIDPSAEALRLLARALGSLGRTAEALARLVELRATGCSVDLLVTEMRAVLPGATEHFNRHVAKGEVEAAEAIAAAMAALAPGNVDLLNAALSCNLALGRHEQAAHYAARILAIDPAHAGASAVLAAAKAARDDVHPLIRLRDHHDAVSRILCAAPSRDGLRAAEAILAKAGALAVDVPAGSELAGWTKHYRLALAALDLQFMQGATPALPAASPVSAAMGCGATLPWHSVCSHAAAMGARAVFFAAADEAYVDLYARWYVKSVLKYADVPCLVIVHVIGGAPCLPEVARRLGVEDERFILTGDEFNAGEVRTRCFDTPPKGLIAKPVAHLQSVRFLRLPTLLEELSLPVFVSDIDLLLQRGVDDLLARHAGDDLVLNENEMNWNAGSRFTANLLLANPTPAAGVFARFLAAYLSRMLARPEVSRWVDQFGLLMARHHMALRESEPRIGYFDTRSDINNVMYRAYEKNPFRFLSLYHGFDTSTLAAA